MAKLCRCISCRKSFFSTRQNHFCSRRCVNKRNSRLFKQAYGVTSSRLKNLGAKRFMGCFQLVINITSDGNVSEQIYYNGK